MMNYQPGLDRQSVLRTLEGVASECLRGVIEDLLRKVDDHLFDMESGGTGDMHALRILRKSREQIVHGYLAAIRGDFAALGEPALAGDRFDETAAGAPGALSLVAEDVLEDQLAQEQLARSLEKTLASVLEIFQHRLRILLGREQLPAEANPVSPVRLARALQMALQGIELALAVRLTVYKFLERALIPALPAIYERLNATLANAGIAQVPDTVRRIAPIRGPERPQGPAGGHDVGQIPGFEQVDARESGGYGGYGPDNPADRMMFASMLDMLRNLRGSQQQPNVSPGAVMAPKLATNDMLNVLAALQTDQGLGLDVESIDVDASLALQLRREVLEGARRMGLGDEETQLSLTDADALDLVGMMFDVLLDERQFDSDVRRKIVRMLVPYVRVAVRDRKLFLHKGHPARRLLNVVTEACQGNRGDGPHERELLGKVDTVIERLVTEYNEDMAIFSVLEQELKSYVDQYRRRSEIAERRAAEAQRGRERLQEARQHVANDLSALRGEIDLPHVFARFIDNHVSHHLTQTWLRQGAQAQEYQEALRAVTGLATDLEAARDSKTRHQLDQAERHILRTILASSGCQGAAADEVIAALQSSLDHLVDNQAVVIEERLPQALQADLPPVEAPMPEMPAEPAAALEYDEVLAERIGAMAVGSWLDLLQDGRIEPVKISWVSPISGRLLLVNRRGIRVLVASAPELAAMVERNELRLREADTAFDDAMQRVAKRLQTAAAPLSPASSSSTH